MREILFRGKDVFSGEWVEGLIVWIYLNTKTALLRVIGKDGYGHYDYIVDSKTVGQYTGLTDKNGKKIFEGDICKFDNDEPDESERYTNYAIQWDCVNCKYVVVDGYNCEDCLDIFFAKHAEVIGNIYDNPELLEVEE